MPDAFLSYSRDDETFVAELHALLQSHQWNVWRDTRDLRAGDRWPRKLGDAITASESFILIWSASAALSDFVDLEWTIAVATKRRMCILALDETVLPPTLRSIQAYRPVVALDAANGLLRAFQQGTDVTPATPEPTLEMLDAMPASDPSGIATRLRATFLQSNWNVRGPVYQAGGDIHVHINRAKRRLLGRWTLVLGGAGLALVLAICAYEFRDAFQMLLPLPSRIAGMLIDAETQAPVAGATVRIVTADGVDVTGPESAVETDSNGVFFVVSNLPIRRSAKLVVHRHDCKPRNLALLRQFETPAPSALPYLQSNVLFFRYNCDCER
jgi:hypothetical protein